MTSKVRTRASFTAELKKIGNSHYLRVPVKIVSTMKLHVDSDIDVVISVPETEADE